MLRNGSLWSNVFFEKRYFAHQHVKRLQPKPFIIHLKAHKVMQQGCFSFIILLPLWWPMSPNFHRSCYFMHMLRYTKWEYWSLPFTKMCPVPLMPPSSNTVFVFFQFPILDESPECLCIRREEWPIWFGITSHFFSSQSPSRKIVITQDNHEGTYD